ncbi:hypothetical protein TNCV_2265481, partial [Trichonephila clavipes]
QTSRNSSTSRGSIDQYGLWQPPIRTATVPLPGLDSPTLASTTNQKAPSATGEKAIEHAVSSLVARSVGAMPVLPDSNLLS